MCEAVTMGAIVGSTVMNVQAQREQGEAAATQAEHNAVVAGYQAQDAIQQGGAEASHVTAEGNKDAEATRTQLAASGVDSTSGSAGNLVEQSNLNAARDAVTAKANAARVAWGFKNQATDLQTQAQIDRESSYLGAAGAGLSGVGQVGSAYASYGRKAGK